MSNVTTPTPDVPDTIRARRFELVDKNDQVIAVLAPDRDGGAELELASADGTPLVRITAYPETGSVLVSQCPNTNATVSIDADGGYYDGRGTALTGSPDTLTSTA